MMSPSPLILLPQPQAIRRTEGALMLAPGLHIHSESDAQLALRAIAALRSADEMSSVIGNQGAAIRFSRDATVRPQGYRLMVGNEGVSIVAADAAGAFYGAMTLRQLVRQNPEALPSLQIDDWPDFPTRGVLLYISNLRVPTMEALFALVDRLAEWKINHLELATEFSFAYRKHHRVWDGLDPMTHDQVLALDRYCRERCVELTPCQQTFGHMEWWLKHPEYRHLAEVPENGFSLCPTEPGAVDFIDQLLEEYLPLYTSGKVNIQCDETFDVGRGRSREAVERLGKGRVYLNYVRQICERVQRRNRVPHFWADIVFKHPNLLSELPQPCVLLDWGYEHNSPFDEHARLLAAAGVPFYVCPSASAQQACVGRTENGLVNRRRAAAAGIEHGAIGYLNTEWCVEGNWHYLSQAYLGLADGAALSWSFRVNRDANLIAALDAHVFQDRALKMGQIVYELGNAYRLSRHQIENGSVFWVPLYYPPDFPEIQKLDLVSLRAAREYVIATARSLPEVDMRCPDAALVADEFANCVDQVAWGIDRAISILDGSQADDRVRGALADRIRSIIADYRRIAPARNRDGGRDVIVGILEQRIGELEGQPVPAMQVR